jgi:hypothetical protein
VAPASCNVRLAVGGMRRQVFVGSSEAWRLRTPCRPRRTIVPTARPRGALRFRAPARPCAVRRGSNGEELDPSSQTGQERRQRRDAEPARIGVSSRSRTDVPHAQKSTAPRRGGAIGPCSARGASGHQRAARRARSQRAPQQPRCTAFALMACDGAPVREPTRRSNPTPTRPPRGALLAAPSACARRSNK